MRKIDWNEKQEYFFDELAQEEDSEEWLAALIKHSYFISKNTCSCAHQKLYWPSISVVAIIF